MTKVRDVRPRAVLLILLLVPAFGGLCGQTQSEVQQLTDQIDLLKKQLEKAQAERALQDFTKPSDPLVIELGNQIALMKKQQEKLQAEKALADAQKQPNANAQALSDQVDLLKKQQEKASAEKDLLNARLPATKSEALNGELKVDDNVNIEVEILSHNALRLTANRIGVRVATVNPKSIVFYSQKEIDSIQAYRLSLKQLASLSDRYNSMLADLAADRELAAALVPEAAATILKSIVDLVALFRTDIDIKGKTVTIDDAAASNQVAREIRRQPNTAEIQIYQPSILPAKILRDSPSTLLDDIAKIEKQYQTAAVKIGELSDAADKEKDPAKKASLLRKSSILKILNDQTNLVLTALSKADAGAPSPLIALVRAELLLSVLPDESSYILLVKVLKAGGNNRIKKSLWPWASGLSHSGGAIVSFALYDINGNIRDSGVLAEYDGYVKAKSKAGVLLTSAPD